MSAAPNSAFPYRVGGGSLHAEDQTYVVRSADQDFYDELKAGHFCYVLNSRQMGKSSLRVRTMHKLQNEGIACADIDLAGIVSKQTTEEQWYRGIIKELVSGFQLKVDRRTWWSKHDDLTLVHRFNVFIEEVLLKQVRQNIVIFVDEIDSILRLDFSIDDFFDLIRACYKKRHDKPEYRRLTWALLGVATPSDLIQDKNLTTFNIGQAIELKGFQLHECVSLEKGLEGKASNPRIVLKVVLDWTGGQPFLTQKLCKLISESEYIEEGDEEKAIGELVRSHIIKNWLTQDNPEHLRTIRDRILRSKQGTKDLLKLYHKIRQGKEVTADDSHQKIELRLSGLVVNQNGKLKAYNRIYESVFDLDWVNNELKALQPNSPALSVQAVFLASVVITVLVMGLRQLGMLQTWELQAFDHLMRQLPPEPVDQRLLIIGADETDISRDWYGHPLPDAVIAQLLDKLKTYHPSAIGLDIVRDQPVPKDDLDGHKALAVHLKQNKPLISVCASNKNSDNIIRPPTSASESNIGFVDLYSDQDLNKQDDTIRRYLLSRSLKNSKALLSPCNTPYSFSWQLAYLYLKAKDIQVKTVGNDWKFSSIAAKRLEKRAGGYQNLDAQGNQLLINYRKTIDPQKIAQQVTVRDVIINSSNFDPAWVKDRVVIIGVTASSIQDLHNTPFGKMRGLYVHAHVVSQILSAVEDNRTLFWWLPQWGDTLWIWLWSCTGGIIFLSFKTPVHRGVAVSLSIIVLYGACWFFLTKGGWIPLMPSALALVLSVGTLVTYESLKNQNDN